jgi:hypothetical protein
MKRISAEDVRKYPEFSKLDDSQINGIINAIRAYTEIVYSYLVRQAQMEKTKVVELNPAKKMAA